MKSHDDVLDLIGRYLLATQEANAILRSVAGTDDLLGAVRCGRFPREGVLSEFAYKFHGVGCQVIRSGVSLDFDLGPGGRCDGFDAWRLAQFAASERPVRCDLGVDQTQLALDELLQHGRVVLAGAEPSPHLYYLREQAPPGMTVGNREG